MKLSSASPVNRKMKRAKLPVGRSMSTLLIAAVIGAALSRPGIAQGRPFIVAAGAGSEMERYLRALSLLGIVPPEQWTVRPFGPHELAAMKRNIADPWSTLAFTTDPNRRQPTMQAPTLTIIENSAFPYGFNDGPVWSGKGLTGVVSGGIGFNRGGFSIALNPVAFLAQNAGFELAPNGLAGGRLFGDWVSAGQVNQIDLPQRFGPRSYGRINLGESHLRWDGKWLTAGIASESQVWGPAVEHPIILGNNAGGIPRLFFGTSAPIDLKVVTVHGQIIWGALDQSIVGPADGAASHHLATAAVGTMGVKCAPGLELGAVRFFHVARPANGFMGMPWLRVFEGLFKQSLATTSNPNGENPDNQLASVFFRWAPPASEFELYGEYGREDHNADARDLAMEPDHDAAYMLGIQRAWSSPDTRQVTVFRAEVLNSRISHLQQTAIQAPWYVHSVILQGHTERGQLLGSAAGYGGGGSAIALDRYSSSGRTTVRWDRLMQGERRNAAGLPESTLADVVHALTVERMRFVRRLEVTTGATLAKEFNRHFQGDAYNVGVSSSVRLAR